MEKTTIFRYYKLGQLIEEFRKDVNPTHHELNNRVQLFLDFVQELNLKVTSKAIDLVDIRKPCKKLDELAKVKPRENVSNDLLNKIINAISKLLTTFEAEMFIKEAFILKEKRFPFESLLEKPEKLFNSPAVFFDSPTDVHFNVKESALCLALDRNTASGLHILLAAEEYVRFFNNFYFEDEENKGRSLTFFELINESEEILKDINYNSELLDLLHLIRKYYRNQTQHASRKFTETEASDLFVMCLKIMNELHQVLKNEGKFENDELEKHSTPVVG